MIEALLYEKLRNEKVRCKLCRRLCVIAPGKVGFCGARVNKDGTLYSLVYGEVSTLSVAPIEIKPLFHFYPGSHALSFGSLGCNFLCRGCQNWEIAHAKIGEGKRKTQPISPEAAVALARQRNCQGLSWTYNEPTLWLEYTLAAAKLAKDQGLYTNYVTNGYMTLEALDMIGPWLDSFSVDIKAFSDDTCGKIASGVKLAGVLETAETAKKEHNMHVEVVTNVIPSISDSSEELKGLAEWIRDHLGPETPWHVTRFYPHLELSHLAPTPIPTLERAQRSGEEAGLSYVYIGNVAGHPKENTWCPNCKHLLIERHGPMIIHNGIRDGRCPDCNQEIPIVGPISHESSVER